MDWFKSLDAFVTILVAFWSGIGLGFVSAWFLVAALKDRRRKDVDAIAQRLREATRPVRKCLACGEPFQPAFERNDVCFSCLAWGEKQDAELEQRRHNGRAGR